MCVVITSLSYEDDTGSTNLFSNASESLQVALNSSQRVLSVPQNVWVNFKIATNGSYNASYLSYASNAVPTVNVTVTLQNGYKTVIPAEELFSYPRTYNDEGQYDIIDDTHQISTFANTTNTGYVLEWGIPYMTMNYVIPDYKRSQFKMAPAIRTDFANQGAGYELHDSCDPVTKATAAPTRIATARPAATSAAADTQTSTNVGAIVGGVVGGILGLTLIVRGLASLFHRSRRRLDMAGPHGHGQPATMPILTGQNMPHERCADRNPRWTPMSPARVPRFGRNQEDEWNTCECE